MHRINCERFYYNKSLLEKSGHIPEYPIEKKNFLQKSTFCLNLNKFFEWSSINSHKKIFQHPFCTYQRIKSLYLTNLFAIFVYKHIVRSNSNEKFKMEKI